MLLLDLPPELLILIAQQIGLRTSVSFLLLSKPWFNVVYPTYLSGLPLSDLYLSSHDLETLPPPNSPLRNLIQAKVKRLSIRLVGHPSKQVARRPWHVISYSAKVQEKETDSDDDWTVSGPVRSEQWQAGDGCDWDLEIEQLLGPWSRDMNRLLTDFMGTLASFNDLRELSFEASSEEKISSGPRWDYLFSSTMASSISYIPFSLQNLTLDLSGSNTFFNEQGKTRHLCPLIARRLHDFENVRLRMRCICPQIFDRSPLHSWTTSNLKGIVVRLSLPNFPEASYELHDGLKIYDAQPCEPQIEHLCDRMVEAGSDFAEIYPRVSRVRVSYRYPAIHGRHLYATDCIEERRLVGLGNRFTFDDDGREWNEWEVM